MAIEHLIYTPTTPHSATMVMLVDGDMFEKYKKNEDHDGVNVHQVMDSMDVFKYVNGKHGDLFRPTKSEIEATFHTTKQAEVAAFMLEHGVIQGGAHKAPGSPKKDVEDENPHSRRHVARSGRPL